MKKNQKLAVRKDNQARELYLELSDSVKLGNGASKFDGRSIRKNFIAVKFYTAPNVLKKFKEILLFFFKRKKYIWK